MANVVTEHIEGEDVVVSGLSGRLPESNSIDEFAQQLFDGVDLVTDDDRRWTPGIYGLPKRSGKLKDLAHFDAMFFGVHVKQVQVMDPQQRLLLEVTYEAIVDAGLNPAELRGSNTGVFVAVASSESEFLWSADLDKINGYALTGCCRPMFPNRVSFTFDLKGPSYSIDTACSSSMSALSQAVNAIRTGLCDAAIVAGTNLCLNPISTLHFHRMGVLSPEGRCATFDANVTGYVRSEAVVAVMLQRRRDARRLYCTVRGARMNTDGFKPQGATYPSGDMQCRLAQETFEEARLRPQDVVWVEAHGTGTKVGDLEEVNGIAQLFCKDRQTPLLLGAVKTNMGHAEIASGMCSLVKILLAMEHGVIPGNLHFKQPNPVIPALNDGRIKVVDKNTPWDGGLVAVNSFGFGGANAHVILEGGRSARPEPAAYPAPRLVLASGRTDEAVKRLLKLAAEHQRDAELHALLDAVHARAIPGHPRRGYAVLDPAHGSAPMIEVLESESEPRPFWFVFSGMGSQWVGMARTLLRLPVFGASIARSAAALKPHGVDLQYVIAKAPSTAFNDIINSFVSIAAVQVALVDVLRELNVHPDGIIGHSLGEIGCAYADGALTAEQTVLCAYWRGRCTLDSRPAPGAMAAVGLSWEDAKRRCPEDIQLACHNSPDNVTISGPSASVQKFTKQLSTDSVFVKMVDTAGIAFHSKYVATAAPLLRARLQQVIPKPKARSARWLSSSVPQDQWESDVAKHSGAEYHVNNFLSPVRFAGVLALVPERAMVVEVAPHALLQAVLKRALPNAAHLPLVQRNAPDALVHLLSAVGKAYAAGAQPQVSRLYPAVSWPVSRGTPSLASHVGWDHSTEWNVADYKTLSRFTEYVIVCDLRNPNDAFLAGHSIDSRVIYPATGYLVMVWRTIAKMNKMDVEQTAVVIENVQFHRVTMLPCDMPVRFIVSLLGGTGEFEVCEGGAVVVTGTVRLTVDPAAERLPTATMHQAEDTQEDLPPLDADDIYKKLRLCGYRYEGEFRGIKSSDARGSRGLLRWEGNWIPFLDSVLQMSIVGSDSRSLYLPIRLQQVVIDPVAQRQAVKAATDSTLAVNLYSDIEVIVSDGVQIRGLTVSSASRRMNQQAPPLLEKYVFLPFENTQNHEDDGRCKRDALSAVLQLVIENCGVLQLKLAEPALQRPVEALLLPHVKQVLEAEPGLRVQATLAAGTGADVFQYAAAMDPLGVKVSDKDIEEVDLTDFHVLLGGDMLVRRNETLVVASAADFVLLDESVGALNDPAAQTMLAAASLEMVSRARAGMREFLLLRRAAVVPATRVALEARDDDYAWVEQLKDAMKRAETEDMRVYVWSRASGSGVQGLAKCLRREAGGDKLRLYYLPEARDVFNPEAPAYKAQVQRDLAFNVLRAGVWGTFRHLPLKDNASIEVMVEHAYADILTHGDLSSLCWIETNMQRAAITQGREPALCRVSYASINFRDVMIATGKLIPDIGRPKDLSDKDCILGYEFSGYSSTGKRVMGIVKSMGIATTTQSDNIFEWEVPEQWSLEEAATVPVAYATAYYALVVRGRMRRGEAVLVHAGAGGVGQAAITIALYAGCTVFTTVGTPDKRAFLRERFPQLPDANIGNSRDCSFEQLVLHRTRGRGVNLVLNSLSGDKLQASLRCLGEGGRFLEIGKVDLFANSAFGMDVLLKNSTVHGILLDALVKGNYYDHYEKKEVARCVAEGIAAGAVRPLPTTVYAYNQLEQAFRYMATGKHVGKVLIRLREEESGGKLAPGRLLSAMPRTYMHPGKSYVLVGGLGGFGLELSEWLVSRGARTLVLNSRSGVRTGYQARCIRKWRDMGVRVLVSTADAATEAGACALLREAATAAPVGGIFNLAVVLRDAFLENQTPDAFHAVSKPKNDALRALDITSRELAPELEYFVAFSSMACGRGNAGQSNYGLANSGMERLCEQRQAAGLPALAVQWGAVGDVGLVASMLDDNKEVGGTAPQRIASCLQSLETLLAAPYAVVSCFVHADKMRACEKPTQDLVQVVANILGIRDLSKIPETSTLANLGVDSLMIAEIKQTLERGYDVLLGVQEIRALTFGKLRAMASASSLVNDLVQCAPANLMPKEVLVKLPSQPSNSEDALFMVHPIEGTVDMLRGLAANVRGTVYGLQCASSAPLDDMAALARFYVKHVRTAQPQPPYTLLGYSFGASIAFEMALQLEKEGCAVRLVLIDGSPAYVSSRAEQWDNADMLAYLGEIFYNLNRVKVSNELKQLPDWEVRVDRITELILASGTRVDKDAVRDAANSINRRFIIGNSYRPLAGLRAPVSLFKARDNYVALDEDYGLKSVCEGELSTRQLAGTHHTILAGDAARAIADHVSQLLAQR